MSMRVNLNWLLWANGVNQFDGWTTCLVFKVNAVRNILLLSVTTWFVLLCSPSGSKAWHEGSNEGALWSILGRQNRSQKLDVDINMEITKAVAAQVQRWGFVRCLAAGVSAAVTQSCQTQHPTLSVGGESSDVYYSSWQYSWGSPGKA